MAGKRLAAGFTIMELLIVIVVMGIVATVALPRLMDRQGEYVLGTRDSLRGMLRLARQLATTKQPLQGICVTIAAAQISMVYGTAAGCNGSAVIDPSTNAGYTFAVPSNVNLAGPAFVRFDSQGRPTNLTGSAVLAANVAITVGTMGLTVYQQTGFVN